MPLAGVPVLRNPSLAVRNSAIFSYPRSTSLYVFPILPIRSLARSSNFYAHLAVLAFRRTVMPDSHECGIAIVNPAFAVEESLLGPH